MKAVLEGLRAAARRLGGRLRGWRRPSRTPTILQMEAVECGAASLAIVLAHHGRWVPLEELRLACGVSRDGSKASNVVKAARRYGLAAKGFKMEPAGLRRLHGPRILHWNFNHFVVLEGIRPGRVYLNDPGTGPRRITEEELDDSFTGVVLTFEPGPDFETGGRPRRLWPSLAPRLAGSKTALAFVVLAGLALVVPGLVVPVFSKLFVDGVLLDGHTSWLRPLLLAMGAAAVVTGILTWLQQQYLLRLETRLALTGSAGFLWHVLRLPVEFFTQRLSGDVAGRVAINDRVAQLLSRDLATNLLGALVLVFFLVVLLRYDVVLTLVGVGVVLLNVLALKLVSRRRIDGSRRLVQEKGKLQGVAVGGLSAMETLKASGGEEDLFARWSGYQAKVVNIRQDLERWTHVLDAVPPTLNALNTAAILGVGSLRVIDGSLSLGGLVAFQVLMASFTAPVSRLVALGGVLQTAQGDMERLDDVLGYRLDPGAPSADPATAALPTGADGKLSGRLELSGVSFGYSRLAPPLIEDFHLTLEPGQRVALVGGSGSGKSTVARLIAGLYRPWSGEIRFDGVPRDDLDPRTLGHSLAVVDQSIHLFEGTVRDNLTLWDPTVPLPEVLDAARDAAIHEDIAGRAGGYDSPVEEGGRNWSGGQRQRLEIARALVGSPSILILDEATSALDARTEEIIDRHLRRRGCTCLIVAHRLSTIRDADEILVMERGRVVERGSHDELMARADPDGEGEGAYASLVAME